jgi:hypothetical protein
MKKEVKASVDFWFNLIVSFVVAYFAVKFLK